MIARRIGSPHFVGLLGLVLVATFSASVVRAQRQVILDAETAHRKIVAGELTLIDVRRPSEWAETGIPNGALAISMHGPNGIDGLLDQIEALTKGDKSAPIALICHSGTRSSRVRAALAERGYRAAYDVSAGVVGSFLMPGWIDQGLPMRKFAPGDSVPESVRGPEEGLSNDRAP